MSKLVNTDRYTCHAVGVSWDAAALPLAVEVVQAKRQLTINCNVRIASILYMYPKLVQRGFSLVQRGLCEFRLMSPQAVDLALGVPSLVMPGAPLVSLPAVRSPPTKLIK